MAINFSASFAACLAANLKVPRQFMYCIAQDAGTPYVLYKDGSERGGAMHWGETYIQQGSSPPLTPHEDHGQAAIASPPMQVNGSAQTDDDVAGVGVSQQQMVQAQLHVQVQAQQQPVLECQEVVVQTQNAADDGQQAHQETFDAHQQASMDVHQQVMQQAAEREHSPTEHSPQWQTADVGQYYARSHMLSPGSFVSYLKQPGVMLTPLNSSDGNGEYGHMPDLVGVNGKQIKSEMRQFKCHTCGKDFKQKSTLLQHERIHTDSRPYGCSECGKRFRQQSHLTQHLRIHANEKPFACVYCERTFRQRAILNQHLRIHSGEKPYGCTECGKRFRQKAILNQHVRTHQDVSPHLVYKNGQLWPQDVPFPPEKQEGFENGEVQCFSPDGQFPAYFKDAKGANHVLFGNGGGMGAKMGGLPDVIQHGRSAGMPLYVRCPICQKEFKQKSTLLQHGCVHIESRPYPCGECGKRFRQQSHLTQHLRIHTNEKPYACVYCGRNFRQRTILNQHVRIHTGEKPYKCGQCGKDFRQKAILDQHTRTHQGDRPYCCPMPNCRRRFSTDQEVKRHVDNHLNPHASKRRAQASERVASPTAVVKPELYFPQCYGTTQVFDHGQYGASPPMEEFKGSPTHALLASPTVVQ